MSLIYLILNRRRVININLFYFVFIFLEFERRTDSIY